MIFLITSLLSAASIVYELLLATTLGQLTGNYLFWYSFTISFYILGLGAGTFVSEKKDYSLAKIETLLSFMGGMSVFVIIVIHGILYILNSNAFFNRADYDSFNFLVKVAFFVSSQAIVLLIGFLSGFEIPLIIKKFGNRISTNKIIAYNYFGTLMGSLVFSLVLMPKFSLIEISIGTAGLNIVIAYFLIERKIAKTLLLISSTILFTFIVGLPTEDIYYRTRYNLGEYLINGGDYLNFLGQVEDTHNIETHKSKYQTLHFVEGKENRLFLDTNFQFNTKTEGEYHESFSHVAISKFGKIPEKVLILGAGDGMLTRELVKYSEIKKITQVELDPKMIDLFKGQYWYLNANALNHRKVKLLVADAFYFVRNTKEKYDAVFIDFPYPKTYEISKLYSKEFYMNIKRILNEDGFAVADAPFVSKIDEMVYLSKGKIVMDDQVLKANSILMSTIYFSGFTKIKPLKVHSESFVIFSNKEFKEILDLKEFLEKCNSLEAKDFKIENEDFPYHIEKKYVNSIFLPKIIKEWSFSPIQ